MTPLVLVVTLGAQFGGPVGYSEGNGNPQCTDPKAVPYIQCVKIDKPYALYGTFTVKNYGEVLLQLFCNNTLIWQGERLQGTSDIAIPQLPDGIHGPCWAQWGALNYTGKPLQDGSLWEYQLTFYGK